MAVVKKGALAPPPLLKKMKIQIYKLIFVVLQILFQNCLNPQVLGDPRLTFEPPPPFFDRFWPRFCYTIHHFLLFDDVTVFERLKNGLT